MRCDHPAGASRHGHWGDRRDACRRLVSGGSTTDKHRFSRRACGHPAHCGAHLCVSARTDYRSETPISSIFSLDSPKICLVYIDKPAHLVFACGPPSPPGKKGCDPPGGSPVFPKGTGFTAQFYAGGDRSMAGADQRTGGRSPNCRRDITRPPPYGMKWESPFWG